MTDTPAVPTTEDYIKKLEKEIEHNDKILAQLGECIDEGVLSSSLKSAHSIFKDMGEMLGLNMADAEDDSDFDDMDDSDWTEEEW